jgi:hypothetical protein
MEYAFAIRPQDVPDGWLTTVDTMRRRNRSLPEFPPCAEA